jgi:hypothetical protein
VVKQYNLLFKKLLLCYYIILIKCKKLKGLVHGRMIFNQAVLLDLWYWNPSLLCVIESTLIITGNQRTKQIKTLNTFTLYRKCFKMHWVLNTIISRSLKFYPYFLLCLGSLDLSLDQNLHTPSKKIRTKMSKIKGHCIILETKPFF